MDLKRGGGDMNMKEQTGKTLKGPLLHHYLQPFLGIKSAMITALTHADRKRQTTLSSFMHLLALTCSLFGLLISLPYLKIESC